MDPWTQLKLPGVPNVLGAEGVLPPVGPPLLLPHAEVMIPIAIVTAKTSETRHRFDILSPFIPFERRQVRSRLTQPGDIHPVDRFLCRRDGYQNS